MKKILSLLLLACFAFSFSYAQAIKTGTVTYSADITGVSDPNVAAYLKSMTLKASFKGNLSRMDMSSMMMNSSTVIDAAAGTGTMIMSAGGSKSFYKISKQDIMDKQKLGGDYKITYSDETKTILGHVCKKATVTNNDGTMVYWLTTDVAPVSPYIKSFMELNGFPLEFDQISRGKTITFLATDISAVAPDDASFKLDTTGYTEKQFS